MTSATAKMLSAAISLKVAKAGSTFARASPKIARDSGAAMVGLALSTAGSLVRDESWSWYKLGHFGGWFGSFEGD